MIDKAKKMFLFNEEISFCTKKSHEIKTIWWFELYSRKIKTKKGENSKDTSIYLINFSTFRY